MIEFDDVSKSFRHGASAKLLKKFMEDLLRRKDREDFYALRNVSFKLSEGEGLAVVGRNGAGKSTLLSLVAGVAQPASGTVRVNGRVAALLELGSGFHMDLTGIENLRLNASLLGLTRKRTEQVFDRIVDFADIGDFIREPVRTYSSGMLMRLAFAVAIHVDPDILIVDEVLAVGDQAFQAKCHARIQEFKRSGKTLMFVSHASGRIPELCERALWLEHGQVVMDGPIRKVMSAYEEVLMGAGNPLA